ncbi:MAG: type I pantothenate kinase [Atopococcus tabaci]|uniref:Pantothenate kinase n=1 Tax=Atopococcus tabaci TaxID=269774 RepID=A0AA43ZSK1_9LACT|nr:type I pantothenate kinase [Atopococcus tabaci]
MKEAKNYYIYNREEWREMQTIPFDIQITEEDIERVVSVNDVLRMRDVKEIYLPIIQVLSIYLRHYQERQQELRVKLNRTNGRTPYIIGVSGSVAVGKSTFSRLLKELLSQVYGHLKVQLITTDGFLYPNEILKEKGLSERKGFPESYDMDRLVSFLADVKNGESDIAVPKYSHQKYDIIPDEFYMIDQPDILIVEGINVLQLQGSDLIFASDFFDFSFYIDAEPKNIKRWYLERFKMFLSLAKDQPADYYHDMNKMDDQEAMENARYIWENINLKNLYEFIMPTRSRAEMIIHKSYNHYIDKILIRKF